MIDAPTIQELLPHAGAMVLIDAIVAFDATRIECRSTRHRDPANPLRDGGRLSALAGVEFAAQAMALHGALLASPPSPLRSGRLAALREVEVAQDSLDALPAPLAIVCTREGATADAAGYAFAVMAATVLVLRGRATVLTGRGFAR